MTETVDVIVIGGGAIGLAIARALTRVGRDVIVLERHDCLASETSARNSEVIHAGMYYPTASLKAQTCVAGNARLYAYCQSRNIPAKRCGKLIVAVTADEVAALHALIKRGNANGVGGLKFLSADDVRDLEPDLKCHGACFSPSTGICDSHRFVQALEADILEGGGLISLTTTATTLHLDGNAITVTTNDKSGTTYRLRARTVINAAGSGASALTATLGSAHLNSPPPNLYFAKGHYYSYSAPVPFHHLIYPVPGPHALGIHFTRRIDGSAHFGPDLAWTSTPNHHWDDDNGKRKTQFSSAIQTYWPDIDSARLHEDFIGVRVKLSGPNQTPADFRIDDERSHGIPNYIALYGIESPGLTASLALADVVTTRLMKR